jgi:DNA-directed RNA polymerase subunit E'/Rpb7
MSILQLKNINKIIELEPIFLNSNLKTIIKEFINKTEKDNCSYNNGYVLDIIDVNINNIKISEATSKILVDVNYNAKTLKPEIGVCYDGVCSQVFSAGIFVLVLDKLKIFIPLSYIEEYQYEYKNDTFVSSSHSLIKKSSVITTIITDIKYGIVDNVYRFNCIGKLKT